MKKNLTLNSRIAEYRKNFYKVYHNTLSPILQDFERERINRLITLSILWICVLAVGISCINVITGDLFDSNNFIWFLIVPILIIVAIILLIWLPIHFNNKFVDELKKNCMSKILAVFGKVTWYDKSNLISDTELNNSDLFASYNRRVAKDAFSGDYCGVKFKICETYLYYESGSGKNRTVIPVFNGVVIKFDSNKEIRNKTIIATRGDTMIKRQSFVTITLVSLLYFALNDCLQNNFSLSSIIMWCVIIGVVFLVYSCYRLFFAPKNQEILNEIKLEDPEFSKKYKAYSSDQIEGRYLITAAFMERFKNVETSFGTNKVKCSFYGDSLMFAISTNKNLFEIGNLFYSLNNPKQMETFFEELTSIFMLVDYFKLDEKTGL